MRSSATSTPARCGARSRVGQAAARDWGAAAGPASARGARAQTPSACQWPVRRRQRPSDGREGLGGTPGRCASSGQAAPGPPACRLQLPPRGKPPGGRRPCTGCRRTPCLVGSRAAAGLRPTRPRQGRLPAAGVAWGRRPCQPSALIHGTAAPKRRAPVPRVEGCDSRPGPLWLGTLPPAAGNHMVGARSPAARAGWRPRFTARPPLVRCQRYSPQPGTTPASDARRLPPPSRCSMAPP